MQKNKIFHLKNEARKIAELGEHTITSFFSISMDSSIFEAHCVACHEKVIVNIKPTEGKTIFSGNVISSNCRQSKNLSEMQKLSV